MHNGSITLKRNEFYWWFREFMQTSPKIKSYISLQQEKSEEDSSVAETELRHSTKHLLG